MLLFEDYPRQGSKFECKTHPKQEVINPLYMGGYSKVQGGGLAWTNLSATKHITTVTL